MYLRIFFFLVFVFKMEEKKLFITYSTLLMNMKKSNLNLIFLFFVTIKPKWINSLFDLYMWAGLKRPFLLIGQPKIKMYRHQLFLSFAQNKSHPVLQFYGFVKRLLQLQFNSFSSNNLVSRC